MNDIECDSCSDLSYASIDHKAEGEVVDNLKANEMVSYTITCV